MLDLINLIIKSIQTKLFVYSLVNTIQVAIVIPILNLLLYIHNYKLLKVVVIQRNYFYAILTKYT